LNISADQYRKIVPEFLRFLSKYGYSQAINKSQVKLLKDDEIEVFSNISIKDILEKLTKLKFHSGKILIHHKNKKIHLTRSHYSQDVILELDFIPSSDLSDLKIDLEKIFPKKKKISPAREAEELKKETEIERKKELKERKKELERIHKEEKEVFEKSKEAEKRYEEARRIREKKEKE